MKVRYELMYDGRKVESPDIEELNRIKKGLKTSYAIYKIIPSKMDRIVTAKLVQLDIRDMREIARLSERGYKAQIIATKFGVSKDYITRILRKNSLEVNQQLNSHT